VLAYVFGRRKATVFLRLKALLEPFGIVKFYTTRTGEAPTSGISMQRRITWGRRIHRKLGTFQNRAKVVDSFCGDGSCLAGGFLKTVNWNLKGAEN